MAVAPAALSCMRYRVLGHASCGAHERVDVRCGVARAGLACGDATRWDETRWEDMHSDARCDPSAVGGARPDRAKEEIRVCVWRGGMAGVRALFCARRASGLCRVVSCRLGSAMRGWDARPISG